MKKLLFISRLFLPFLIFIGLTGNAQTLSADENTFQIDHPKKLVVITKQASHTQLEGLIQLNGQDFIVETPADPIQTGVPYTIRLGTDTYTLYFTQLPVINIYLSHINDINQVTEIPGYMYVSDEEHGLYNSTMAIRIRGASSASFPKKSYRVQLKDGDGRNKHESILGMRTDRRWLMLAMYNEKLRLNNKFSHGVWLEMHKLYYEDQKPGVLSTIRTRYVEAFINSEYRGVYLFTEDADKKQFGLEEPDGDGDRGELFKGEDAAANTMFIENFDPGGMHNDFPQKSSAGSELWGGWELRHPDESTWDDIYGFTHFVLRSSDEVFREGIADRLHLENAMDYFIFINLTRAMDNTGKNSLIMRYDRNEPYFYGVWDLDGTIGYIWNGTRQNSVTNILTNGLFSRLLATDPDAFRYRLASRWKSLRQGMLKEADLWQRIIDNYNFLVANGVYVREKLVQQADGNWDSDLLA